MQYRRSNVAGGCYFFTVNLANRKSDLLVRHIDVLREVINSVKERHPFKILAMVILPEHLHTIWRMPMDDTDYPLRWSLIKSGFSRRLVKNEPINISRKNRRERGIWQRRYWEHQIRDDHDLSTHVDYIHYNPAKHGLVKQPEDWNFSTLNHYIKKGLLPSNWGCATEDVGGYGER